MRESYEEEDASSGVEMSHSPVYTYTYMCVCVCVCVCVTYRIVLGKFLQRQCPSMFTI